jgi:hypothetical protein
MNNPRDGIWVSKLNARPEIRSRFQTAGPVRFYDTTLRDGEQTVGVVLDPQQKLALARKLDEMGVSRIEAGFPRVSAQDSEAIKLILEAHQRHQAQRLRLHPRESARAHCQCGPPRQGQWHGGGLLCG